MKRGCRPIGVSVIQLMMRHYLGKANLLTMKDDETGQFGRITPPFPSPFGRHDCA